MNLGPTEGLDVFLDFQQTVVLSFLELFHFGFFKDWSSSSDSAFGLYNGSE
jgi:hypothetical protein